MSPRARRLALAAGLATVVAITPPPAAAGQGAMPDARAMSGVPLPTREVPAGTATVRVVRGALDNPVVGLTVEFDVDGTVRRVKTDESGRATLAGLASGARVRAVAVVDGERLESQPFAMESSGVRVMLVAPDPAAEARAAEDRRLAAEPAVPGAVVFGPETRVILEMADDRLSVFYVVEILNTARTPVDIGGPVLLDLPRVARGARVLEGSSPQATANGPRVTVTGPFAPGATMVHVGYEMPYDGAAALVEQVWPAPLQRVLLLVPQTGGLAVQSPQVTSTQEIVEQGQPLIVGHGPAIAAGGALRIELSGLPHHAAWPRRLTLALAGGLTLIGLWTLVVPPARRRAS